MCGLKNRLVEESLDTANQSESYSGSPKQRSNYTEQRIHDEVGEKWKINKISWWIGCLETIKVDFAAIRDYNINVKVDKEKNIHSGYHMETFPAFMSMR